LLIALSVWAVTSVFSSMATAALVQDEMSDRVPTEELIEGIKSRDGRWFEVELIIFKRTDDIELREHFSQNVDSLVKPRQWDLVRDLLQPDVSMYLAGLPECHQDKNPLANLEQSKFLSPQAFYKQMMDYQTLINRKWQFTNELCLMPNESLSGYWKLVNQVPDNKQKFDSKLKLSQIPQTVTASDYDDLHNVYVIAQENLKLTSHFNKLKNNPHTEPMLHIGWRQPGLSKREARPVYLVAGKNYTDRFKYDGSEKLAPLELEMLDEQNTGQQDDIRNFMKKIQSGAVVDFKNSTLVYPKQVQLPDETWQLDGFIEVHLDHYLYIEGQFNFRELSKEIIDPEKFLAQLTKDKALESVKEQDPLANALSDEGIEIGENQDVAVNDADAIANAEGSSAQNGLMTENENKQLITINYLKNYNFKQTRKSYSGDLHYLDHPKMGILIQVRKYRH